MFERSDFRHLTSIDCFIYIKIIFMTPFIYKTTQLSVSEIRIRTLCPECPKSERVCSESNFVRISALSEIRTFGFRTLTVDQTYREKILLGSIMNETWFYLSGSLRSQETSYSSNSSDNENDGSYNYFCLRLFCYMDRFRHARRRMAFCSLPLPTAGHFRSF